MASASTSAKMSERIRCLSSPKRVVAMSSSERGRGMSTVDDLLDAPRPGAHHVDRVAEVDGLVDVVRDEDDRAPVLLPDLGQEPLRARPGEGVERAERLVHEQHVGVVGERAGDGDALLHPARELARVGAGELGEAHLLEQRVGDPPPLVLRDVLERRPELDVLAHAQPREQRVALEDHPAVGPRPLHRAIAELDRPRGRADEARHDVEQRRLAAAGRAHDAGEVPVGDLDGHVVERPQLAAPGVEGHGDAPRGDRAHRPTRSA